MKVPNLKEGEGEKSKMSMTHDLFSDEILTILQKNEAMLYFPLPTFSNRFSFACAKTCS
jgi:patatin-like phospholipase/acyl hydrolase